MSRKGHSTPLFQEHPELVGLPFQDCAALSLVALNAAAHNAREVELLIGQRADSWRASGDSNAAILDTSDTNMLVWRIRSFFWELHSVSELIFQWCNVRFALGLKPEQVRWSSLEDLKVTPKRLEWAAKRQLIKSYVDDPLYFEITKYRNYSHRAMFGIQLIITQAHGLVALKIPPARVGQPFLDLRAQLNGYVAFAKRFGGDVLL